MRRRIFLILALGAVLVWAGPARAGAGPPEAEKALAFAQSLLAAGDYDRAAGEAKRFLFFCPDDPRAAQARALLRRARAWGRQEAPPEPGRSEARDPVSGLIRLYQEHLRGYKPSGCPSYPSCSEYTLQAIARHGPALGVFIFVDRLFREFTEGGQPPLVLSNGRLRHYDPLERNDYWLGQGGDRE